jgi:hypothetical protein
MYMIFKYFLVFTLLSAAPAYAADQKGNYAVWGIGQKSCFSYTKARAAQQFEDYKAYLMGYITAYNTESTETYSVTGMNKLDFVLSWMDDHCRAAGIESFEHALRAFTHSMQDQKLKEAVTP